MPSSIGIGFIGSGFAQKVQAPAFEQITGAKLVGAASPNNSEQFSKAFGMPFFTPDWKELIKHPEVDLVCVASPPKFHYEQAKFALEHGKHVLCEKPFTMNYAEARKLYEISLKGNSLALIDHELRFSPGRKYVRGLLNDNFLGQIYFARAESYLSSFRKKETPVNWWFTKENGGGTWGAIGSHMIDQLRFFVGEISSAKTITATAIKERQANDSIKKVTSDDVAASVLKFSDGAIGTIFTTHVATENKMEVELTGEKGSLKLDLNDDIWFNESRKEWVKLEYNLTSKQQNLLEKYERSTMLKNKFSRAFIFYADAIISTLLEGKHAVEGAATFKDGMEIQRILDTGKEA